MSSEKIKVMIVEDDPDFIFLTKKRLLSEPNISYVGDASNRIDACDLAHSVNPDIILMDLNLTANELDGIETAKRIRCSTQSKILIVSSFEDYDTLIKACVKSFASGYIFKSQYESLIQTINFTANGITPQEYLIHSLIMNQLSDAEKLVLHNLIGEKIKMHSSAKTIANQKTSILKKLGLNNQNEIIHIFNHYCQL